MADETLTIDAPETASSAPASDAGTGGSTGIVESTSDLLNLVDDNMFSDVFDSAAGEDGEDAAGEDDQPSDLETEDDETGDEEELGDKEPEPIKDVKPAATDELPEGVTRGKDRNGKAGLFVEDSRWKNIYSNHQLVQKVSEALGEPATEAALVQRHEALVSNERMYHDLTSADPEQQSEVLGFFLDKMAAAKEAGEISVDASIPLAESFYKTLRDKSPDGYAKLRYTAARDLLHELFTEAAEKGDEDLRRSSLHLARALAQVPGDLKDFPQVAALVRSAGYPFPMKAEMAGFKRQPTDPMEMLRAENARLRGQIEGNTGTSQAAQLKTWAADTNVAVEKGIVDDAVKPALASVEQSWKQYPTEFKELVVDRLHRQVLDVLKADEGFNDRIKRLSSLARRAPSAQRRSELGQQIQTAFVNRAKLAVEATKRPVLEFAANRLKERADQSHDRRQASQKRTAPNGANGTVPRSIVPKTAMEFPNGEFDPAVAVKHALTLLGR